MEKWIDLSREELKRICFMTINSALYCTACKENVPHDIDKLRHALKHVKQRVLCVGCTSTHSRTSSMWDHYIKCHKNIIDQNVVCTICKRNPYTVAAADIDEDSYRKHLIDCACYNALIRYIK